MRSLRARGIVRGLWPDTNREADNWRPLFAIAEIAGGDWPDRCARAFEKVTKHRDTRTQSIRVDLLADVKLVFDDHKIERVFSRELVNALVAMSDRPWPEAYRGKPIPSLHFGLSKL